jgi:hypothetical protein
MTFSHLPHFNSSRFGRVMFCPACDSASDLADRITDRYGFDWVLATCTSCGLKWQRDPLTDAARQWFYRSGEYRRLASIATGKPWDDPDYLRHEQRAYAARWSTRWETHEYIDVPFPTGRWLDYGGSTGEVSGNWRQACPPYEQSQIQIIVADYGDGATVTPEQALEMGTAQPYDAVLCCQTLDHLPNPLETLKTFLSVTREGGSLFVDCVKKAHTAYKVDHEWYVPTAACFVGMVERAGWSIQWLDAETNSTHYTIGAVKKTDKH